MSSRRRVLLEDALLTVALVAFDLYAVRQPWDDGQRTGSVLLNSILVPLAVLPFALRRTDPVKALGLMTVTLGLPGVFVAHDYLFWGELLPFLVLVFGAARADHGWAGRLSWTAPFVVFACQSRPRIDAAALNNLLFALVLVLATWTAGRLMHRLDRQGHSLSAALAELEATRDLREAAAVGAERARIAGEMHDVVAHAVSLMVLQVGAARFEVDTSQTAPEAAGQLRAAERAGRDALDELRRSLTVLRAPT